MHALASELYPICRSITGEGLRATLRRIQREIPITLHEVPSGTPVLDWTVPDEWNIREAWIANARGERVVDLRQHNLHVVNYSVPVRARLSLAELRPRLHTLPERPDWIPYRTTYYKRDWGYCLTHRQLQQLEEGQYEVCIDATLAPGALSYGELLIPGESGDELLISCHCCHPSLANDNLSGVAVAVALAKAVLNGLRSERRAGCPPPAADDGDARIGATGKARRFKFHHSIRLLFIPGTIGAITWLARNCATVHRITGGLVLTSLGDAGGFTYKRSRRGNAEIDRTVEHVLQSAGTPHRIIDFLPYGYDERQFCSPGFNLPVGCLMRSQHGTFPEYHTSADNLEFIKAGQLAEALAVLLQVVEELEGVRREDVQRESARGAVKSSKALRPHSRFTFHVSPSQRFLNLKPHGEPQLGKYKLYEALDGDMMPALWVLNFSDGAHSLEEIAARSGVHFDKLARAADILTSRGLLKEVEP
jgi:aminopeptidase-like protein